MDLASSYYREFRINPLNYIKNEEYNVQWT